MTAVAVVAAVTAVTTATVLTAALAAGPVGPEVRAVELAFVLLLGGCATGALALLGAWRRKDR
ncbi:MULTISPECIES: hypothetical protein [Streptomyces]|uniref:hypothetical protein n=1 Tax=Streptomyces TaxID=1883 RepID=UPI0004AA411F|nr:MULTISPECIES: hypothetical protein [Streptomyces]